MSRRVLHNFAIAGLLFVTSGCLLTTSKTISDQGAEVPVSTLRQIEIGQTTGVWLIATLGEPTSKVAARGPGSVEIWSYDRERAQKSHSTLFLLFAGSSQKIEGSSTYFEITDGVVTKYWTQS